MMEAVKVKGKITEEGRLEVDEPVDLSPGEVEVILLKVAAPAHPASKEQNALEVLKENGFWGMWKDREDMGNSVEWVRKLRERENRRSYHVDNND